MLKRILNYSEYLYRLSIGCFLAYLSNKRKCLIPVSHGDKALSIINYAFKPVFSSNSATVMLALLAASTTVRIPSLTRLQEFMTGKAEKKGRMTYRQLQKKSVSKFDSIEVSDSNIGDFLETARKYDIDYALKRDKSTEPSTYHVFFSAANTESFKRAFSENGAAFLPA